MITIENMRFNVEAIIGDRYHATDSLTKDEIHTWLINLQKKDFIWKNLTLRKIYY